MLAAYFGMDNSTHFVLLAENLWATMLFISRGTANLVQDANASVATS